MAEIAFLYSETTTFAFLGSSILSYFGAFLEFRFLSAGSGKRTSKPLGAHQ
jgi:hypothetical protein